MHRRAVAPPSHGSLAHFGQTVMSSFRAASTISALTLVSRILGLIRDSVMAWVFGASWVSGTFLLAWTLPNLMRRLLGEGALSASFLPAYTAALRREGPEAARSLLTSVSGTVTAILIPLVGIVVVGSLLVPPGWLPAPEEEGGADGIALLLTLNAILFPYTLPVCLSALYSGALNSHRRFAAAAAAPIVLNLFWIAGLVLAGPLGISIDRDVALFVGWFLFVGGIVQLVMLAVPLRRLGALSPPAMRFWPSEPRARAVFVTMAPMVLGMSLAQFNAMLDQFLAYYLVAPGATNYVYLANRLLLFPHALTALAVAVAVFPKLAELAADADHGGMRRTLDDACAATLLVTLPAAVGLMLIADDLVAVLFQRGRFTAADAHETTLTTVWMVAGLPMIGLAQLTARAFYAVGDARTPARQAAWLVLVNLGLNLVFVLGLGLRTAGLAMATSITATVNAILLQRRFRRHAQGPPRLLGAWLRCLVATGAMALVLWLAFPAGTGNPDDGRWQLLGTRVLLPMAVAAAVYFAAHWLMRSPELAVLRRRRLG